ncbi:poly(A) polymerase [Actinobacillus equuli]|nr:poly(A) polymerase [Actinobacillus equuli]
MMRAEIEGGDLVELSAWWHEYQFSNDAQRAEMLKAVRNLPNFAGEEKKKRRRKTFRKKSRRRKPQLNKLKYGASENLCLFF